MALQQIAEGFQLRAGLLVGLGRLVDFDLQERDARLLARGLHEGRVELLGVAELGEQQDDALRLLSPRKVGDLLRVQLLGIV